MKLKRKVKGAMTYPITVLAVSIGVMAILLLKVIPVFQSMFEGMGSALPAPTQFIVDASLFARNYFSYMGIGLIILFYGFKRYYATEKGKLVIDALVLKVAAFRTTVEKSGRGQIHKDPCHDDAERCTDYGRYGHRQPDLREQDH